MSSTNSRILRREIEGKVNAGRKADAARAKSMDQDKRKHKAATPFRFQAHPQYLELTDRK